MTNPSFANRRRWLLALAAAAVLLACSFLLLRKPASAPASTPAVAPNGSAGGSAATPTPAGAPLEFLAADLVTVQAVALSRGVDFSGPLVAVTQAVVRARAAGELVELTVREGDAVRAGQIVGRIDPTEAIARQKERQALLASAQAQLDAATKTLNNNRDLFEKGFVSQAVVDTATSNVEVARAQRDAAAAQLQVAEKQLGDTRVLAPLSGQVSERLAQPGERLALDARILGVVDASTLEVQAALPVADIARVRPGQTALVSIEGLDTPRAGRVSRIAPAALGGSRSVPVFVAIDGSAGQLRPGLYGKGRINTGAGDKVLAVPQTAIRDQAGRQVVYRISPDERLQAVAVQTGALGQASARGETWIEVVAGLQAGDRVVGVNLGTLREGAQVKVSAQPVTQAGNPSGDPTGPQASPPPGR